MLIAIVNNVKSFINHSVILNDLIIQRIVVTQGVLVWFLDIAAGKVLLLVLMSIRGRPHQLRGRWRLNHIRQLSISCSHFMIRMRVNSLKWPLLVAAVSQDTPPACASSILDTLVSTAFDLYCLFTAVLCAVLVAVQRNKC